jgi:hypothetical protein
MITKLTFTNTVHATVTVSVWTGSAATDPNQIRDTKSIAPLDVFVCYEAEGRVLEAAEQIFVQASSLAITNATNANPIVITTAAHNLTTGDGVTIIGVGGNTNANGTWVITVLSSTTYSLNTGVGNGGYTSGGTSTPHLTVQGSGVEMVY